MDTFLLVASSGFAHVRPGVTRRVGDAAHVKEASLQGVLRAPGVALGAWTGVERHPCLLPALLKPSSTQRFILLRVWCSSKPAKTRPFVCAALLRP